MVKLVITWLDFALAHLLVDFGSFCFFFFFFFFFFGKKKKKKFLGGVGRNLVFMLLPVKIYNESGVTTAARNTQL